MILYHNITNSDHKSVARKILAEQTKRNQKNTTISKSTVVSIRNRSETKNMENMSKSKWKKAGERTRQKLTNKTKARTIIDDKWERKNCLQECDSDTINDVIKVRLHMWQVSYIYKRDNTDTKCPLFKNSENMTVVVVECEKDKKLTLSKENNKGECEEIT